MAYYPIFLEMEGRRCLVIGGGKEAQRKVTGLMTAGARVTVIAPKLTRAMQAMLAAGEIEYVQREYQDGDVEGYAICMIDTHDRAVN
ncbi:MAG: siroheme synthase, partial [Chloroflexi bacterium]|nr:siroheme synthase [Chloroflexota bacterium]